VKGEFIDKLKKNINNNIVIEGDNLAVLSNLLELFKGKIDVMPIDPPYNTEIKHIEYNDNYNDHGWIEFMKPRLRLAYELLSETGAMFIHIDENEFWNLKEFCAELFGVENLKTLIWKKVNDHFDKNRIEKPLLNIRLAHEYVLVCFKNIHLTLFNNIQQPVFNGTEIISVCRPIETILDYFGTTASAKDEIEILLGSRDKFSTPKPMKLIKEFIRASSNKNSYILDFFAGSGTTAHACMDLNNEDHGNRNFILVTNNESDICTSVTIPRIENAIKINKYNEEFICLSIK